jgi:dolichol-phosphate mannosyltransferase
MRHIIGMKELPPTADSFCLLDRRALDAFRQFPEAHLPVTVLINWMGFRHERIPHDQPARLHGRSGWTLEKKIQLALDSMTSYSNRPIRVMWCLGILLTLAGGLCALRAIYLASTGSPVRGWFWLLSAILAIGGLQMSMLGLAGEYLWRALVEAQRRPRYLIEESVGAPSSKLSLVPGHEGRMVDGEIARNVRTRRDIADYDRP